MAYTGLYEAIAKGALSSAIGILTGSRGGLEAVIARIAEPPIGVRLTMIEAKYLSAIGARANVSMERLLGDRKVWSQDIPIVNMPGYANIEGGRPGVYNYQVVISRRVGRSVQKMPVMFSSDDLLSRDDLMSHLQDYLDEESEKLKKYGLKGTQIDRYDITPVALFKTTR